jgi:hypothetical protein
LNEVRYTGKAASPSAFAAEFGKPAFQQVESTGTGRDIMHFAAPMTLQKAAYLLMFVRSVIVHDQVQFDIGLKFIIELVRDRSDSEAMGKRDRSDKRGEREWGVDTGVGELGDRSAR